MISPRSPSGVQAGSTGQIKAEELLDGEQIGEIVPYRTIGKPSQRSRVGRSRG